MKGHTNCRYCSRRWNTTSCISQMRLFKQPCQKCSTASIQLRFISKQDSMSLRLPWWEANEDILLFHNNAHTIENFVYILQRKTLRWTRYSLGLKPFLLFRFQPFFKKVLVSRYIVDMYVSINRKQPFALLVIYHVLLFLNV